MGDSGSLTISIDLEIGWGRCDAPLNQSGRDALAREREIVARLLSLFKHYNIRATWAVVGHLLVKQCDWRDALVHPDIPRPVLLDEVRDWFFQHPLPEAPDDLCWYGRDVVDLIRHSTPAQEIGSHSFCHLPYSEKKSCAAAVNADLFAARAIHDEQGLPFDSFVFPRNVIGYLDLLAQAGVKTYRGKTPHWFDEIPLRSVRRSLTLASYVIPIAAPTVKPELDNRGLVNIPDSMLLIGRNGLRRLISMRSLAYKGLGGLHRAVRRREVFHLWFHPSNFVYRTDEQFTILENLLRQANELRSQGLLEVKTMNDYIDSAAPKRIPRQDKDTANAALWRSRAVHVHDDTADSFRQFYDTARHDSFASSFSYGRQQVEDYLIHELNDLPKGSRVLDAGCGTGDQLGLLRRLGYDAVGVEPADRMREIAERRNPGTAIHKGVIGSLPFPDKCFDAVIAIEVLRYLHPSDIVSAYREVLRVLKPGGRFVFTMVNRYAFDGFFLFERLRALFHRGKVHCEFVTPGQVRRDLEFLGGQNIECVGRLILPLRVVYRIHPRLGRLFARGLKKIDLKLARFSWLTPFAGHLIVTTRRSIQNSGSRSMAKSKTSNGALPKAWQSEMNPNGST
jgi:SAM-dependent methyltransferase